MSLETAIRQHVNFVGSMNRTGFNDVRCMVCGDTKIRGGFKFESDGTIVYHCFRGRCDASCVYKPEEGLTWKFKRMLEAFRVPIPTEIKQEYVFRKKKQTVETYDKELYEKHSYRPVQLPEKGIERYDPDRHHVVRKWLAERSMDDRDYYIGSFGYWGGRILIPMYLHGTLIGWEGASLGGHKIKYEKGGGNTDLMYFPLGEIPREPILVEGIFDAKSVPFGVGTLHSSVSRKQAFLLRNCDPILLPDREGSKFLEVAKEYGWRVIIPKYKEKDPNAALKRYGRLALAAHLRENIISNLAVAENKYKLWQIKH